MHVIDGLYNIIRNLEIRIANIENQKHCDSTPVINLANTPETPIASPITPHNPSPLTSDLEYAPVTHGQRNNYNDYIRTERVILANRYEQLPVEQLPLQEVFQPEQEVFQPIPGAFTWAPSPITHRPDVCYGEQYVNNMNVTPYLQSNLLHQPPAAPNPFPIPASACVPGSVLVVSDSMTSGIRVRDINETLNENSHHTISNNIRINRYAGAHAEQINYYSKYPIDHEHPETLVIIAGTNDVGTDVRNNNADPAVIADRVVQIGREAKMRGVKYVCISSIMTRRGRHFNNIISETNLKLRLMCTSEGFHYIDNTFINLRDLYDGLHLNNTGKLKLTHSILTCCESYNPAIGPMWDHLSEWPNY